MGVKNKQRRAAKAKQRARERDRRHHHHRSGDHHTGHHDSPGDEPLFTQAEWVRGMLELAASRQRAGDTGFAAVTVDKLGTADRRVVEREAEAALLSVVGLLWDNGWQPAELVRHGRRASTLTGRLVTVAVAADHVRRDPGTLHPRWAEQLASLSLPVLDRTTGWLASCADDNGLERADLIAAVIDALSVCYSVGPLETIIPPPGTTHDDPSTTRVWPPGDASDVDDSVLTKVRALLAKAESTAFEAEAATFTAKAQELMARHSIDAALAWARTDRHERPATIRLPVDNPYADVKSLLLQVVAEHSRCRAVYHERYGLSSVVGFAGDVAAAETLYTSLLVQSQVALQAEAKTAAPGGRTRSRSFRSSFLMSYTRRIDARLAEINAAVEADAAGDDRPGGDAADDDNNITSVLPVLAERSSAVDDEVEAMFGELTSNPVRGGDDGLGWTRGKLAADRAQLSFADIEFADGSTAGGSTGDVAEQPSLLPAD